MDREDTIEALKRECERLRITRLDARRRAKRFKHAWEIEKSKVRSAEDQARMQKDLLDKICESVGGVVTASIRINRLQKTQDRLFHENEALQAECEKLRKDAELWETIHDEIHRRADKEHALADRCDFDVTIMYEDYAAIDAAMAGGDK